MTIPALPNARIIDSHAHVVKEYFAEDQDEVIERAFASGVVQMVNPGVTADNIPELLALSERHPNIFVACGVHPHEAKDWDDAVDKSIRQAAAQDSVVAIGECGLDFFYNNSDRDSQLKAFAAQIKIALEFDKPVIVHCRDAWQEAIALLEQEGNGRVRGVFHCFTGDPQILPQIAALDFYVSFSGIVTFPNAKGIQAAAKVAPQERILVETDCPFLAPQKVRGKKNEPSYVWYVAEKLAELRGVSLEEICQTCCQNTRRLFRLSEAIL